MNKKIYVLADSMEAFKLKVSEYVNDPMMDCTGLDFIYLTSVGQIDHSRCEIWDCSGVRKHLADMGCEVIYGM